jgi:hypothetical protein
VIPPVGATREAHEGRDYAAGIYGSLLVTGFVAVQWRNEPSTTAIALSIIVSVVVFWLAHVWSEIVNRRVRGRITIAEAAAIAGDESAMLSAAVLPAVALAFGPVLGLTIDQAIATALIVSIGQLFLWGLIVGRAAHTSWPLAIGVAVIDSLLGILIVVFKNLVLH